MMQRRGCGTPGELRLAAAAVVLLLQPGSAAWAEPPARPAGRAQIDAPSPIIEGGSLGTLRVKSRARAAGGEDSGKAQGRPAESAVEDAGSRLLVAFSDWVSREEKELVARRLPGNARLLKTPANGHFDVVEIGHDGPVAVAESLRLLSQDPRVRMAEQEAIVQVHGVIPRDPRFGEQWALLNTGQATCSAAATNCSKPGADVRATDAWSITTGSSDVVVAVIDTGVDYNHPDLAANILRDSSGKVVGYDFVNDDADPMDDHGHGTHSAGIIGAVGDNGIGIAGMAWKVRLMPVKAMDSTGTGRLSDVIAAIDYAVEHGAQILNCSFGTWTESQLLLDTIRRAEARGVLLVASAGNEGGSLGSVRAYPAMFTREASNVVSVAATDGFDALLRVSNYGSVYCDVAAPGFFLLSTVPEGSCAMCEAGGYGAATGTSTAAAMVSGAAALIKARYPGADARQMRARLLYSSDPILAGYVRHGRLNAFRALREDEAAPEPPGELTVAGVTSTSMRLVWKAPSDNQGRERVSDYFLAYSETPAMTAARQVRLGIPPGEPGTEESFDLTGLNPETDYWVELRSVDLAGNLSAAVQARPARTARAYRFEGAENRPTGRLEGSGTWEVAERDCHSGKKCFFDPPMQEDIVPYALPLAEAVEITGGLMLSFWMKQDNADSYAPAVIEIEVQGTEQTYRHVLDVGSRSWTQLRQDLSAYEGKTVTIRLRMGRNYDSNGPIFGSVTVDDIAIAHLEPVWQDDVEGAAQFSGLPPWSITEDDSASPRHAWTDSPGGLYANNVMLPLLQDASVRAVEQCGSLLLRFRVRLDLERIGDFLYVYASPDDGGNWLYLGRLTGRKDWAWYSYALPDGWKQARLLFLLSTNDGGRADGLYLDDIGVWGEPFQRPGAVGQTQRARPRPQTAASGKRETGDRRVPAETTVRAPR